MKHHISTLFIFISITILSGCATSTPQPCTNSNLLSVCPDVPPQAYKKKKYINSIGMEFVFIPSGCFVIGGNDNGGGEKSTQAVNITKGFWMQATEVTQEQWFRIMRSIPSKFRGKNRPVEQVSWNDVQELIEKLNAKEKGEYRLPTYAEWEYSCRGGKSGETYCGGNNVDAVAWYVDYSNAETHQVAGKHPNDFGLYDMSGNVWEWVSVCYYGSSPKDDPQNDTYHDYHTLVGGSWQDNASYMKTETSISSSLGGSARGFRLVFPAK